MGGCKRHRQLPSVQSHIAWVVEERFNRKEGSLIITKAFSERLTKGFVGTPKLSVLRCSNGTHWRALDLIRGPQCGGVTGGDNIPWKGSNGTQWRALDLIRGPQCGVLQVVSEPMHSWKCANEDVRPLRGVLVGRCKRHQQLSSVQSHIVWVVEERNSKVKRAQRSSLKSLLGSQQPRAPCANPLMPKLRFYSWFALSELGLELAFLPFPIWLIPAGCSVDTVEYWCMRECHVDVPATLFSSKFPCSGGVLPHLRKFSLHLANQGELSTRGMNGHKASYAPQQFMRDNRTPDIGIVLAGRGEVRTSQVATHGLGSFNAPIFVLHLGRLSAGLPPPFDHKFKIRRLGFHKTLTVVIVP
ncbi:hypothetical protein FNV43_RR00695 [Rhamnella rubrinervis]|uniref:Uncharacterized protein n=1 Tax=Rhamnella rubrinervis TaxID=2594499 RepID=A0A8K0MRM5_9ROSA|nr:hypothetical protein FNV43_RR00695 [Rhamnella rubrinervis]